MVTTRTRSGSPQRRKDIGLKGNGGQFASKSSSAPGSRAHLQAVPSDAAAQHKEHSLAHLGIITTTDDSGVLVARNTAGGSLPCPHCRLPDASGQDLAKQAVCSPCAGRGFTSDVPFCDREWDCIETNPQGGALFLGGHDAQPGGGEAMPEDKFDLVVSLYTREGQEPHPDVEHLQHTMIDGPLDPADHPILDRLAERVADAYEAGDSVLVRCQAGMNRSGLVLGLAMIKLGHRPEAAIEAMRAERGPWVLFNDEFRAHIHAEYDRQKKARRSGANSAHAS